MNLEHFDELLDTYLLGELSAEQSAQLQEALQTDPAARSRFVQSIFIETGLHHLARSEAASLAPRQQRPPETSPRRHITRRRVLAAVGLVAVSAVAVFYFVGRGSSSTLARVASGHVLVDGQSQDRIAEGSILSVTGPAPAVIDLSDGSRATLDPATQLTLRGRVDSTRQVLHLTAGGGQFQVPHGGGQFRIDTPVGSVTVLGTEFTAVLRSPHALFLSVTDGTVQFDGEGKTFTLSTGQSRTVGPEPDSPLPRANADAQVKEGWIGSVDLKAVNFVLVGKDERQTTFKVGVKPGEREADILLDGKKVAFPAAIQPKRKATITYVTVGKDLWVTKAEVTSAASAPAAEKKLNDVAVGYIHSVDLKAGSFVLGGKNQSQTTFRFGVKAGERRADCLILLDGKMADPATAIKPGRKASVTYVKVGDELGASKVEITSAVK